MKTFSATYAALLMLFTGMPSCTNGNTRAPASEQQLIFDITGNVSGTLEPCGCVKGQLGGLAKRAWAIGEARRQFGDRYLLVDYGNLLYPSQPSNGFDRAQRLLRARTIAHSTAKLKLDAYNLTIPDLEAGREATLQILRSSGLPFVSANLRDSDGRPIAPAYLSVTRKGLKIAITGVAETYDDSTSIPEGIKVVPAAEIMNSIIPKLRIDHDLVVILSHVRRTTAIDIAKKYGPAVIIGAQYDMMGVPEVSDEQKVLSVGATTRGRHVARLQLIFRPSSIHFASVASQSPAGTSRINSLFTLNLIPIEPKMTDAPDFRRTIDEMKRQLVSQSISDFGETASVSLANEKPGYAGTHTCKNCHQIQYEYWSKHSHAKAMDTLRRTNNQTDATCIGCHSLGYGQPDGYYGTVVPKFFENVQCETCHGMAGIHLDDVLTHKPSKTVPKSTCMACHGAFHEEKPFNYDKMLPLASCPSAKPLEPDPPSPDMEGDTGEILGPKNLKRPE